MKYAERLLVKRLSELLPQAGFLTEEETTKQDLEKEWIWIIDPLDGTTNFVHGLPIYSVSIALKHKDELVVGVVYEVGMDECFLSIFRWRCKIKWPIHPGNGYGYA